MKKFLISIYFPNDYYKTSYFYVTAYTEKQALHYLKEYYGERCSNTNNGWIVRDIQLINENVTNGTLGQVLDSTGWF